MFWKPGRLGIWTGMPTEVITEGDDIIPHGYVITTIAGAALIIESKEKLELGRLYLFIAWESIGGIIVSKRAWDLGDPSVMVDEAERDMVEAHYAGEEWNYDHYSNPDGI